MRFRSITINNFGAIGSAEVALDSRGLVLIQGENVDDPSANSNGAGKSTIVEALSWCLFGVTAKGISGDHVVNRQVGKDCMVQVIIEDGHDHYLIQRHRKHRSGKNSLTAKKHEGGSKYKDLTKGTDKLTQDVVNQIVGCSHEVFVAAVYAGQEAMPDLPSMTDKHLKLLIEEAAGITLLEQAHVIARGDLQEAKQALQELELKQDRAQSKVDAAKQRVEDARVSVRKWKAERDARVIDLETEARNLIGDAKSIKEAAKKLRPEADILREQTKLKETLDGLDREKAKRDELAKKLRAEERLETEAHAGARATLDHVKKLQAELDRLKEHIGKPCTACKRPHTEESLKDAIAAKTREIAESKTEARRLVEAHKDASESVRIARTALSDYESSMTDTSTALALSDALREQREAVHQNARDYDRKVEDANKLITRIKSEKAATCPYTEDVKARIEELEAAHHALVSVKDEFEPARMALKVAQGVVEVFSPRGVRSHILDTVTPYLNERTGHYLGSLADGRIQAIWQTITLTAGGEARDKFSIKVTHDDGGDSFAALSGGEKRKVRIATALALQDLVATRATKPIDIWIGDEIDAALDAAGLERLMNVLEAKARERGTVLVISHSDLKEWFRETITVTKEDGVSKVAA